MKIIIKEQSTGSLVKGIENWPHPKSDKQWKCGRSAMELAKFSLKDTNLSGLIKKVLTKCELNNDMNFECYPEYKTYFGSGMGKGGPRVHDMLLVGDGLVIGIEAKVSEPFDEKISEKKQGKDKQGKTRADKLTEVLRDSSNLNNENIRYQLLTATYGTMKAAIDNNTDKCIMLVVVFKGNVCKEPNYKDNCKKNDDDFNSFCKFVNLQKGYIVRSIKDKKVTCWIKKVEVEIGTDYHLVL